MGRDRLLDDLRDELLVRRWKVLVLVGQGGIGKTSLAVKLLEACGVEVRTQRLTSACDFARVLYVRVQEGLSFDGVVSELGRGLEVSLSDGMQPGQMIDALIGGLQRSHCLVVLDNLEDVLASGKALSVEWGQLLWALVDRSHDSQVVITSREVPIDLADPRDVSGIPSSVSVRLERVDGIDDDASVELLRELGLRDSEVDLRWVAGRVAGQVQVLTLLAKWARKPGMLRQRPELVTADAKPILRVQLGKLRESARDLLKRMCVLRVGIGLEGLTFLRLYEEDESEFGRFWMATEIQEPIEFDALDQDQTRELVNELVNVSLVDEQYDERVFAESYRLHRVIVEFMQDEYALELPELIKKVYSFYRSGSELHQPKRLEDLRPLLEAQHFAFQLGNYDEAESLIYKLEEYLEIWGYWSLIKSLCIQLVNRLDDESQPYILQRIGLCHLNLSDFCQAESYYRQALELALANEDLRLTASLLGNLGSVERDRGNRNEAKSLYQNCLKIEERLNDSAGVAATYGVLGDIERDQDNWSRAERLYKKSLRIRQDLGDALGVASIYGQWGYMEFKRKEWRISKTLYQQSLKICRNHGYIEGEIRNYDLLGDIEYELGNRDLAESLYKQSRQLRQELANRSGLILP